MISLVATSRYIPNHVRPLNKMVTREFTQSPPAAWRESCGYFCEFLRSYGFDDEAFVAATERIDCQKLRNTAGLDHIAVEEALTLPDMCVEASRKIIGPDEVRWLRAIVVCQTSCDAEFNTNASTVLRLQCEYGLKELAFAVGDHDGANFFVALSLIGSICEGSTGPTNVLLCCGERWREPFPRVLGTYTILGDAAGTMLLSNEARGAWRLCSVQTESIPSVTHPWRYLIEGINTAPSEKAISDLIGAFLDEQEVNADDVTCVVPPHINRRLVDRVHSRVGFSRHQGCQQTFGRHGYLCAADPIVRLHDALANIDTTRPARVLVWGIGLNGTFGCALFAHDGSD